MRPNEEAAADVVIAGGAIMGTCVAWFLRHLGFNGSILIAEPDPSFFRSSTTLSAASIRQQFSLPENMALSRFGLDFIRSLPVKFGPDADVGFVENGYLLLSKPASVNTLLLNHAAQRAAGADITFLDRPALIDRFPWLNASDLAGGCIGESGEGWFDAHRLLALLRADLKNQSVEMASTRVVALDRGGDRVERVVLEDGRAVPCGHFVNAAGPAAAGVARLAGIDLPVEARKRTVFVFTCREAIPEMPLTVDPDGIYVRPEGHDRFITGTAPDPDMAVALDDLEPDYPLFEERIWPVLAHRVAAFEAIRFERAWAGHYEYNTLDQNGVIGPHPELTNFHFINGFSGHGLQQAPAAGRAVAEHILHGGYRSIDCAAFGYDRIAAGRPFRESNII